MSSKMELSVQWFPSAFPRLFHPLERGREVQGPPRLSREPEVEATKSFMSWLLVGIVGVKGAVKCVRCDLSSPLPSWLSVRPGSLQPPRDDTSLVCAWVPRVYGERLHLRSFSGRGEPCSQKSRLFPPAIILL